MATSSVRHKSLRKGNVVRRKKTSSGKKKKKRVNKVQKRKIRKPTGPPAPPVDKADTSSDSKTSETQPAATKPSHWFRNLLVLFVIVLIVVVVVLVTRLKSPNTRIFPDRSSQETTEAASSGPGTGIIVIFVLFLLGGLGYAAFQNQSKIATFANSLYSKVSEAVQEEENKRKEEQPRKTPGSDANKIDGII